MKYVIKACIIDVYVRVIRVSFYYLAARSHNFVDLYRDQMDWTPSIIFNETKKLELCEKQF